MPRPPIEHPNWPDSQIIKRAKKGKPFTPKRLLITARIDAPIKQLLVEESVRQTASRYGYQPIVNAAISFWMKPESYVCIIGTDEQGIISVTHHLTEYLANQARLERRIVWTRQVEGVWYGKIQDGNRGPAWCQISKVTLEKK